MNPSIRLPDLPYRKTTLSNGLDVLALRSGRLPIVAVNLWYHVGSKNEERTQRGFAHLFEHLMFEGSEHYPGDFFKPLQRLGASVNGSTSTDRTNYFVDLPSAHVELAVAMESDRMGHLIPALSDEKIRVQKDVVKNEYRQNYANRPYGQVWKILAEALYPPDHPYSWLTIGAMEDVERASRDDIEAFFGRYYVPGNASLALVGDIDEDHAFSLAEKYFGPIPGGTKALPVAWSQPGEPLLTADRVLTIRDRVELDRLYLCWPTVPQFDPMDAPLALLADVLARGRSSRLFRSLVMDRQIAQDVTAYHASRELAGTFGLVATLRPGRSIDEARDLLDAELADISERGVTEDELERVRNGRLAGFVYALDNVGGFGGVADRLNAYNTFLGDPGRITTDFLRFQDVSAADVLTAARQIHAGPSDTGRKPRVEVSVLGRKARSTAPPVDRSIRPGPAPASAFLAPRPEIRTLKNGASLWIIPRRDLPIVAASAVVTAGASAHGPDSAGLASLTANMMDEGTEHFSAADLALAAENMGTNLSTNCGWDGSYVTLQCLSPHLDRSLELAVEILLRPTFPEPEFARIMGQTLASLKAERDSADSLAYRGLIRAVYGADHPYRTPVDGDESTVAKLSRDDLKRFHRSQYRPDRAAFVVAGDVDPDRLADSLEARLSGWSEAGGPPPAVPEAPRRDGRRLLLIDRPGAPQAVVRVGHAGPPRRHEDHDALMLFNQILGGMFTSRLNAKLREEKGFTYGIRSSFDSRRGPGPFSIAASLQADRLAEAIADLVAEAEALLNDRPPTPTEARRRPKGPDRRPGPPLRDPRRFGLAIRRPLPPRPPARRSRPPGREALGRDHFFHGRGREPAHPARIVPRGRRRRRRDGGRAPGTAGFRGGRADRPECLSAIDGDSPFPGGFPAPISYDGCRFHPSTSLSDGVCLMRRRGPRALRVVRYRVRRFLRRLDRDTPEWLRWLTPWGVSLVFHSALLVVLGVFVYVATDDGRLQGPKFDTSLPANQLVEDVIAAAPAEKAGDTFTTAQTPEPPSFSAHPDEKSEIFAVPESFLPIGDGSGILAPPPIASAEASLKKSLGPGNLKIAEPAVPFSGRSSAERAKLVRREGGTVESEKAVELGLDWLARHQRKDGSWSLDHHPQCKGSGCPQSGHAESDVAATGLALLPMLGAGQNHITPGRYQATVKRGLDWLLNVQKEDGELFTGGGSNTRIYSHAIGTMTLCEAYGLTHEDRLHDPAQKAVNFLVRCQSPDDGGWRYNPMEQGDTSVFGWAMLALRSAQLSGLKVPGEVFKKASTYLDKAATDTKKGSYGYQPGGAKSPVMSAEALLVRQYLGWPREMPELSAGVKAVSNHLLKDEERNIYYWYYATQLLHNMQNLAWKEWNPRIRNGLISIQVGGRGCDRGSWDPNKPKTDRWGGEAGRHYTTAMSLLTLEVYYRYLPLYKARDRVLPGSMDEDADDAKK